MEIILYIAGIYFVFWLGQKTQNFFTLRQIYDDPDRFIKIANTVKKFKLEQDNLEDTAEEDATAVKVERHGDMLYAYTKHDDQFVAQGKNLQELLDQVKHKFPNQKFFGLIEKDNPAKDIANLWAST